MENEFIKQNSFNRVKGIFIAIAFCLIFWAVLIFLLAGCSNGNAETVSKSEYDLVVNDNQIKADKITQLQTVNDSLYHSKILIENKFKDLNKSYDSLFTFAKTRIEILQDSLFGFKNISDSTINDFLGEINRAVILNIDSISARIKRNYESLK